MRSNGEGTIIRRKDGRWQASLQIDGKRRTVYGRTRGEAAKKLAELQNQASAGGSLPSPGKRTLDCLLDLWLEIRAPHIKPKTLCDYRQTVDCYIRPTPGKTLLSRLEPARIERLLVSCHDRPRTAQKVHLRLSQALALGVRWGWLSHNPCDRVDRPRYRARRKELWTPAQLRLFLDGTRDHWLGPLWTLLAYSGIRLGEALALEWSDVDLAQGRIVVTKTVQRIKGDWVTTEPKTRAGMRVVTLPSEAVTALRRQAERRVASGAGALVFMGERGLPLGHGTVDHAMQRACKQLGLPPMTPHGLRHLHASLLLAQGLPIPSVSQRLGHANSTVTMAVYAHALNQDDSQATAAIARAIGE